MIFVDSNVFVIDLRYPRDRLRKPNRAFLDAIAQRGDGATTLVNLLEVAGILSHNLNPGQIDELVVHFPKRYGVRVLPPMDVGSELPAMPVADLLALIRRRCSFGDALVLHQVERYATPGSRFVTWDAVHFQDRTAMPVQTPKRFLKEEG